MWLKIRPTLKAAYIAVSTAVSVACAKSMDGTLLPFLTPHVNKSPFPLIGCGTKAPLLWRKQNLWLMGKVRAVVLVDLCLCFKGTQIFLWEITLHTLNMHCPSSHSDLHIFKFRPQLHIVWYRYTNVFCTKYTTTIGAKMWACQFFNL